MKNSLEKNCNKFDGILNLLHKGVVLFRFEHEHLIEFTIQTTGQIRYNTGLISSFGNAEVSKVY